MLMNWILMDRNKKNRLANEEIWIKKYRNLAQ